MIGTTSATLAKPFIKWAGGKQSLLPQLLSLTPFGSPTKQVGITKYAEPFLGGGAMFFHLAQHYHLEKAYLSDLNPNLILTYRVIKNEIEGFYQEYKDFNEQYLAKDSDQRREFFLNTREAYNVVPFLDYVRGSNYCLKRAAQFIYLNKSCFNGLHRVNKKGLFNVPMGSYSNPTIFDWENLSKTSKVLAIARINHGGYRSYSDCFDENTFVYLDPPYRPLSPTAQFNSYTEGGFTDDSQEELARFYRLLDKRGVKVMLSNSDPRNHDPSDTFFDDLYAGFNIHRIQAKRSINSKRDRRGYLSEIVVTNY